MSRIRITGGTHRSRLIEVADVAGLRPTPDRVRETLFNWLGQDLTGLTCLDLFAGSGILGFEAASRGASQVTLVERDAKAMLALKAHLALLKLPQVRLVAGDALKFTPASGFDLIFLDPPYNKGLLDKVVPLLPQLAAPGARIYAEAEQPLDALGDWQVVKQGHAGQVYFHLLEHTS
ncbi:MAG TPA: 16S rRNA (guanine(966)-N(2))-methyltransferase RsmD [Rhodocyclaceae bacterium]|jgi:16S rRNA (guanine(966)-N(2))-methyltransferase RsmD|nr:16S rRNA (guanine(966)-N(2))-methyltransferase RsmD [Rhodocyclaceae bacterium]